MKSRTIYWRGSEDEEHRERMKACKARRKQWGQASCAEKDGSCPECDHDMAVALRITKEEYDALANC